MKFKFKSFCVLFFLSVGLAFNIFPKDSGKHFILTLPKYNKISEYCEWLEKTRPAGVMLTEFHMQDRAKTKQFCASLQEKAQALGIGPLIISVDYEGGIVSRGADVNGFISVPSPYKLAKAGRIACCSAGKLIGHQLRDAGITINFAPCLDLFDPENYILATRCFSSDPHDVAIYGSAFVHGLLSEGVLPTIKHFPGLSAGNADTHTNNVTIDIDQYQFDKNILPFRSVLSLGLDIAIMVGHAEYKQFDGAPASSNPKVVSWIRQQNPNALIIADDTAMQSYHRAPSEKEKLDCICDAAIKSINAGVDLLILSASAEDQIKTIQKLDAMMLDDMDNDKIDVRAKITELNKKLNLIVPSEMDEQKTSQELVQKIDLGNASEIPATNKLLILSVDLSKIRPSTSFQALNDAGDTTYQTLLASLFKNNGNVSSEFVLNPMSEDSIDELKNLTYNSSFQNCDNIILQTFFFSGSIFNNNQKEWLKLLRPYAKKLTIISLGHPYERLIIPDSQIIELGSFNSQLIHAAFDQLKKKPF